jgi:hypothetical protein
MEDVIDLAVLSGKFENAMEQFLKQQRLYGESDADGNYDSLT